MKSLKVAVKQFPRDKNLGRAFREMYMEMNDVDLVEADKAVHRYSNDEELGAYVRSNYYLLMRKFLYGERS